MRTPHEAPDDFRCVTAGEVDPARLDAFLQRIFGAEKGAFLRRHGDWWHRGARNRFAILSPAGDVAAYYTTTPATCLVDGRQRDTLWWIDLIVDPRFRRRGLQTMMDNEVRGRPGLKLGIPNQPHSVILARHGWHVRGDLRNYLLPLRPGLVRSVRKAQGARGRALRAAARLLAPGATLWRRRLGGYRPRQARRVAEPSARCLAEIFARHRPERLITTARTADFLQWRYLDAPHRDQLNFYSAGPPDAPTHYLISRQVTYGGLPATRILDVFGDFAATAGLEDIVRLAVRDAVIWGAGQVTAMAAVPGLQRVLRRLGFLLSIPIYFCYHDSDPATRSIIDQGLCYWTLGDSDIDNTV